MLFLSNLIILIVETSLFFTCAELKRRKKKMLYVQKTKHAPRGKIKVLVDSKYPAHILINEVKFHHG